MKSHHPSPFIGQVLICEIEVLEEDEDRSPEVGKFSNSTGLVCLLPSNVVGQRRLLALPVFQAMELTEEVRNSFRTVMALNAAASRASPERLEKLKEDMAVSESQLAALSSPREVSFWVAQFLVDARLHQQRLLEEESTFARLQREKEYLEESAKYLRAAAALKSLGVEDSSSSELPPPGGPD
jgi:hypothetical protein